MCRPRPVRRATQQFQLGLLDLAATNLTSEMQQLGGQTLGVLQDLHGDVVGLVSADGELLETWEYDVHGSRSLRDPASGAVIASSVLGSPAVSQWGNPLGNTGRPRSAVSGLHDMRARHYSAQLRIYTAPDPLGFVDSVDLWQYTAADPLNFVDPFGLSTKDQQGEDGPYNLDKPGTHVITDDGGGSRPATEREFRLWRSRLDEKYQGNLQTIALRRAQAEDFACRFAGICKEEQLRAPQEPRERTDEEKLCQATAGFDAACTAPGDREGVAEWQKGIVEGGVDAGVSGYGDPTVAVGAVVGGGAAVWQEFKRLQALGRIRRGKTVQCAPSDELTNDVLDTVDPKAGSRFKRAQDSLDQLDSIAKKQDMLRKGKTSNVMIDSKRKSERRFKNDLNELRGMSPKDIIDEFD